MYVQRGGGIPVAAALPAALVACLATAGCYQPANSGVVWFEASATSNGIVTRQGAGRPLELSCNPTQAVTECTWHVTINLANTEPLSQWALNLEAGPDEAEVLAIDGFEYDLSQFDEPLGPATTGPAPHLLTDAAASASSTNGVPVGLNILGEFNLTARISPGDTNEREIAVRVGHDGWMTADGTFPYVRFAANGGVAAVGQVEPPLPVILITSGEPVEKCNDGIDNDGDMVADCLDPDCFDEMQCADRPVLTCPPELVIECDGTDQASVLDNWLGEVSVDSVCNGLTLTDNLAGLSDGCGPTGSAYVTWTAIDECGGDTCSASFAIEDTIAPTLTVPQDFVFACGGTGAQTDLVDWIAAADGEDSCSVVTVTFARGETQFDCTADVIWTATDECGNATSDDAMLTIQGDATPPVLSLRGESQVTLECGVDSYLEMGATITDDCDATALFPEIRGNLVDASSVGNYVVTYDAVDLCGHAADQVSRDVQVADTLAPDVEISDMIELWPPTGEYIELELADCVDSLVDACEGPLDPNTAGRIISIYSDERETSDSSDVAPDDIVIVSDDTFRLRIERQADGNGRVYGVLFEVSDLHGNTTEATCTYGVPAESPAMPAVDDGVEAGHIVERTPMQRCAITPRIAFE